MLVNFLLLKEYVPRGTILYGTFVGRLWRPVCQPCSSQNTVSIYASWLQLYSRAQKATARLQVGVVPVLGGDTLAHLPTPGASQ